MIRAFLALACSVALSVSGGTPVRAAETVPDSGAVAALAPVDSVAAVGSPLLQARLSYQKAWAERQAGSYDAAVKSSSTGLEQVSNALLGDPDHSTRNELVDLQSRLNGLHDAAVNERNAAAAAAKTGNVADEKVLNAPAADEIEPQVNDQVLRWIEFFTGGGRSTFERWLKRSGRYMELFRAALQREGLPPDLVHLVFVESGFNLNARSVSAAVGPWQFLRGTARLFGLTVNQWVDERRDPEKSTVAAARYLKHLYAIFGDWPLALASYNAGEGTVLRAIRAQGTTNYWDLRLPRQTEDYVPQFMAILAISRDPAKYGFDSVELDEPMVFDEVALKGAVDLRAVARMADCSYDEIKLLNPAVLHHATNGANGVTTIRVPRGKGEALMQKLQTGGKLPAVDLTIKHRVRRGETLNSLAADYHVSAKQLALANGIGRKRPLRRGMTIVVPGNLGAPAIAQLEDGDPRASTSYVPARMRTPIALVQGKSEAEGRTVHTVHRGETLAAIAAQYGVSTADLRRWNHLQSDRVRRGTRLKVRTGGQASVATPAPTWDGPVAPGTIDATVASADGGTRVQAVDAVAGGDDVASTGSSRSHGKAAPAHKVITVKAGSTLSELAEQHGSTVRELMRINHLSTSRVRAGQKLRVPAAS